MVTNRHEPAVVVDREHRQHAVVELAIRDLKAGAGLSHVPSGHFSANGAWLACAVLAYNILRWIGQRGRPVVVLRWVTRPSVDQSERSCRS